MCTLRVIITLGRERFEAMTDSASAILSNNLFDGLRLLTLTSDKFSRVT